MLNRLNIKYLFFNCPICVMSLYIFGQGGRGHWAIYYTSPQVFTITFLIRCLNNFGDFTGI